MSQTKYIEEELIESSKSCDPNVRKNALKEMCPCNVKMDIDELWERIYEMKDDPDPRVRYQVIHSLCDGGPRSREEEIIEILRTFWNDKDKKVRKAARRALTSYQHTGNWNIL